MLYDPQKMSAVRIYVTMVRVARCVSVTVSSMISHRQEMTMSASSTTTSSFLPSGTSDSYVKVHTITCKYYY